MTTMTRRFDFDSYFDVLRDQQTYMNVLYLFLSFPLGIAYFVMTVTLASVGAGLSVIGVGLLILVGLMLVVRGLAVLERQMVRVVLNMPMEPVRARTPKREGIFGRIQDLVTDTYTYRALGYALVKFPLGIISFVLAVVSISIVGGFIAAPLMYNITFYEVFPGVIITSMRQALVAASVGVLLAPIAARVLNLWAHFCGTLTRIFLSTESALSTPARSKQTPRSTPAAHIPVEDEIHILKEAEKATADVI